jgi:RNA polymerase sigma factor (TIGR02999 family)
MGDTGPFTTLLTEWRAGDEKAGQELIKTAYKELRQLASYYLQNERPGHTLQPTALVHELYLKLFGTTAVTWQDRSHFFAVAAQQLRRLLIDHARAKQAGKRGGGMKVSLNDVQGWSGSPEENLIELNEALSKLETLDPRAARVVELRFFGGLQENEAAEALGISVATLKRDWKFARTWLASQLMTAADGSSPTDKPT